MSEQEELAKVLEAIAGIVASLAWPACVLFIAWLIKRDMEGKSK